MILDLSQYHLEIWHKLTVKLNVFVMCENIFKSREKAEEIKRRAEKIKLPDQMSLDFEIKEIMVITKDGKSGIPLGADSVKTDNRHWFLILRDMKKKI
jgi:hypothetical protein